MLELLPPQVELRDAWTEAHREWGPGLHEDGFGISAQDDVDSEHGFREWIDRLNHSRGSLWWIVENGQVLGGIALRSPDDERVGLFGHVGYGVRPSARGRGVATWALGQTLERAAGMGIDPVLAVCRDDNAASIATISHFDATLLSTEQHGEVRVRRYALAAAHVVPRPSKSSAAASRRLLRDRQPTGLTFRPHRRPSC
jgi:predicted acetyltransferase